MWQEENEISNYRAAASRSPGLNDSLRKWASSQPAGNEMNDYRVSRPKAPAENEANKGNKENKIHGAGAAMK